MSNEHGTNNIKSYDRLIDICSKHGSQAGAWEKIINMHHATNVEYYPGNQRADCQIFPGDDPVEEDSGQCGNNEIEMLLWCDTGDCHHDSNWDPAKKHLKT